MKKVLKYLVLFVGTIIACRFIWFWTMDEAFGPGYETVRRYPVALRDVVMAEENGGATTGFATSFHVMMRGSNPSSFNRVLVVPNAPADLTITEKDGEFSIRVAGRNKLNLPLDQSLSGIRFHLAFSE